MVLDSIEFRQIGTGEHDLEAEISFICEDSRKVVPGALFVAVAGVVTDGHRYLSDAVDRGCVAIMVEKGADYMLPAGWHGTLLEVDDTREAYGTVAENWYGRPAEGMKMIGVTGTNGKTTVTYLLEEILLGQGFRVGVIGTVNYRYTGLQGRVVQPSPFTTPQADILQRLLAEMVDAGVEYVIMEVSSHALSQSRIGHLRFDVAAFTNLTRDHLDYHRTMEEYFLAKTLLFSGHLRDEGKAVLTESANVQGDDDWVGRLASLCGKKGVSVIACGAGKQCRVQLLDCSGGLTATKINYLVDGRPFELESPLVGNFNVDNLLTSIGVAVALGLPMPGVVSALTTATGAPGRLQRVVVAEGQGKPVVFVDYAHTPDALKQVLTTLAALPHRELYCVFGCGGDRDAGKRPVMGSFAGCFADVAVITDDNPRSEDPEEIRRQVVPGLAKAGMIRRDAAWLRERAVGERGYVEIGNRKEAIRKAICGAGENDIVLVAGKGHEAYQLTLAGKKFFDDRLEAEGALLSWDCRSVVKASGGTLTGQAAAVGCLGEISTDSRSIRGGDIFVALKGDTFDGHDFLDVARQKRAGCLVVEHGRCSRDMDTPVVEVDDTLHALGDLAGYRRRLTARLAEQKVIAITGSCGKTTVKEMTAAILRRIWPGGERFPEDAVLQTRGNLNNLIGLPLSLLPLSSSHRAAVLEMGMNVPGEIARMTEIADPDICCITNIHGVHLAGLGSVEGVADAKEELFRHASENAVLIVNLDDEHVRRRAEKYPQRKVTFTAREDGAALGADLFATGVNTAEAGMMSFTLNRGSEREEVHLYTAGRHNVTNAVAAAAIATAAGADMAAIAAGLSDFRPADRRMVIEKGPAGLMIINDTYNANPVSMAAAIKTLRELAAGRCMAVLGDMLELGETAPQLHRELGVTAGEEGIDYLAVVGEFREQVAEGARSKGLVARTLDDKEQATAWVREMLDQGQLGDGDWLLVKASRGLKMETIVNALQDRV